MNNYEFDAVVIGAGPAGLFAAINISDFGLKTCLIEKTNSAGKKLLMSGNGQCNLTNTVPLEEFIRRYGGKNNFVKKALHNYPPEKLLNFFRAEGIEFMEDKNGKIFPECRRSKVILDVLIKKYYGNKGKIFFKTSAREICRKENKFLINAVTANANENSNQLQKENLQILTRYLIVCTGGVSYPMTGSTGDGYLIAENFGHEIISPEASLNSVSVKNYFLKHCGGIAIINSRVIVMRNNKKISENTDDLLFTHTGLSGPVILNLCRYIKSGDELHIEIAGTIEEFLTNFKALISESGKSNVKTALVKLNIPERLVTAILGYNGIDGDEKCANVKKETIAKIVSVFSPLKFTVNHPDDIKTAMATAGGINLKEVNSGTMESKICENLFFAGEVMDVDGDTGGFNLQWAFSSAKLAAEAIIKKNSI